MKGIIEDMYCPTIDNFTQILKIESFECLRDQPRLVAI